MTVKHTEDPQDEGRRRYGNLGISRRCARIAQAWDPPRPAGKGTGFEASREMKSGFEIKTFLTQKAAEHWIIPADIWGPLQ
jgi:hypothetical protein